MARTRFLPAERGLIATAAGIVFTRVFAFSLTTLGFTEFARGLSNYSSPDVEKIRGKKTPEVRSLLGQAAYDEVVHRDNLVIG